MQGDSVLLFEDSTLDAGIITSRLREASCDNLFHGVSLSVAADWLHTNGRVDIHVLDLTLPQIDGIEISPAYLLASTSIRQLAGGAKLIDTFTCGASSRFNVTQSRQPYLSEENQPVWSEKKISRNSRYTRHTEEHCLI
jgi:hypothetical protein